MSTQTEHPFAQYVRILGKGKTGSRSLSQTEARDAMAMILAGQVEDVQLGAFLMLLRVKEESSAELAGFVQAVRDAISLPSVTVDLDWASYAGKRRQQAWYLLAALALADSGLRVVMHGASGHTAGRVYSEQLLAQLGETPLTDSNKLATTLDQRGFAFLPLHSFSPVLQRIIDLRNLFGLRSPVHTLSRLINPLGADYSVQSIFHPAYGDSHQQAAKLLGQPHAAVFKGEAGEAERKPEATCTVKYLHRGQLNEIEWPRLIEGRQAWQDDIGPAPLLAAWREDKLDDYGRLAILATMAIVLQLRSPTLTGEQALSEAERLWQQRDRKRLPANI